MSRPKTLTSDQEGNSCGSWNVEQTTEVYTIHDLLSTLMDHFKEEKDKDGCMLVAAIGKHIYDKEAKGSGNGEVEDRENN